MKDLNIKLTAEEIDLIIKSLKDKQANEELSSNKFIIDLLQSKIQKQLLRKKGGR